jgi:hypothetical protein
LPSMYAYSIPRSSGARVEDPRRSMVIHKHRVVWVLTLFVSKASPGTSHQYSLGFLFNHYLYDKLDRALSL